MRASKYSMRMSAAEELESISMPSFNPNRTLILLTVNEGMDEIYNEAEEERPKYEFLDAEIDSIMRQAFTGKKDYSFDRKAAAFNEPQVHLRFKRYNDEDSPMNSQATLYIPNEEVTIPLASLDYSLDMLKNELIKNELVLRALGINAERAGYVTTHLRRYAD